MLRFGRFPVTTECPDTVITSHTLIKPLAMSLPQTLVEGTETCLEHSKGLLSSLGLDFTSIRASRRSRA